MGKLNAKVILVSIIFFGRSIFPASLVYADTFTPLSGYNYPSAGNYYYWAGTVSTDWFDPANWLSVTNGISQASTSAPTPSSDVFVTECNPNLNCPASNVGIQVRNLTVGTGVTLKVNRTARVSNRTSSCGNLRVSSTRGGVLRLGSVHGFSCPADDTSIAGQIDTAETAAQAAQQAAAQAVEAAVRAAEHSITVEQQAAAQAAVVAAHEAEQAAEQAVQAAQNAGQARIFQVAAEAAAQAVAQFAITQAAAFQVANLIGDGFIQLSSANIGVGVPPGTSYRYSLLDTGDVVAVRVINGAVTGDSITLSQNGAYGCTGASCDHLKGLGLKHD